MEEYIKKINATQYRIRDPLYGFIALTDAEMKIINTPIFQRLRRIHQLALTNYVYPSAEHSRFVHSLGVMHCATLILAGICGNKYSKLGGFDINPDEKTIKTLGFAALLHDVGHLPFSHAVERQWLCGSNHEAVSMYIINNYPPICEAIQHANVEPKDVALLLKGNPSGKLALLHAIISGQLDADRADYLLRDSYFCGVRYGEYDLSRFLGMFAVQQESTDAHLNLYVDEDDLPMAESMLIARYHYNLQIPYHRTRSGYDIALRKFVTGVKQYNDIFFIENTEIKNIDFDKFEKFDDGSFFELAKNCSPSQNYWADYVLRKKHLKIIFDTNNISPQEELKFKNAYKQIINSGKWKENEDFFTQEQEVELLKGANPKDNEGHGDKNQKEHPEIIRVLLKTKRGLRQKSIDIRERSWIFGRLRSKVHRILRIFATPEAEQELSDFLREVHDKEVADV